MTQRLLTDTDVLIDYLRDYSEAVAYIENTCELLLVSVITVAELYAGIRNKQELIQVENFLRAFEKVSLDEKALLYIVVITEKVTVSVFLMLSLRQQQK